MTRVLMVATVSLLAAIVMMSGCALPDEGATQQAAALEEIYLLRSIREPGTAGDPWCTTKRAGFAPFPEDAERFYSFWSVRSHPLSGRLVDTAQARVAALRGCFGPTQELARQNFYAEISLAGVSFHGRGECPAILTDAPERGLFPVRCQLVLDSLPAPYVGGLLTTNTITSSARFGSTTRPAGYTQASIATIRLWKARTGSSMQKEMT